MKITTEDCVEKIVEYYQNANDLRFDRAILIDASQWKRVSKTGNKTVGFTRLFSNRGLDAACQKANTQGLDIKLVTVVKSTETEITSVQPSAIINGKLVEKEEDLPAFVQTKTKASEAPEDDFIKELAESPETLPKKENKPQSTGSKYPTLAELKANQITVPFGLKPKKDLSGRVIYDLGDDGLECSNGLKAVDNSANNKGDGEFSFYCGPEQEDGCLDDRGGGFGNDKRLEKLFADFGDRMFIGAAENYHTVKLIPGISAKELWEVIVERLKHSGAVLMEGGNDGSNEDDEDEDEDDGDSNDTEAKFEVNAFDGKVSVQFYVPAEGAYLDKTALSNLNIPSSKFSVPMLNDCGLAYLDFNGTIADCKALLTSYGYHEYFAGSEERKLAEQVKNAKFNAADWVFGFKADEGEYGEGYIYLIKKAYWDKEKSYDHDGLDNELEAYGFPEEFTCEQESCYTWQGQGKNKAGLEWLRKNGIKEVKLTHQS